MIFRYPGGKSRKSIRKKIFSHAPPFFSEYREPFVGGGGIFFTINPNRPEWRSVQKRWINDLNPALMEVYFALRDRPREFIELCRTIKPAEDNEEKTQSRVGSKHGKKYNARLKKVFDDLKYNELTDQALRYFFLNRTIWGGRVNYDPKMECKMYFSNPEGWNIVKTDKLERAASILKGTEITTGDYSILLLAPGRDVYIYCDPPYMRNTELSNMNKLYEFGFSKQDHLLFADYVKKSPHKICISYDDEEEIREIFSDSCFSVHKTEWNYCGSSMSEKKVGKELIITKY